MNTSEKNPCEERHVPIVPALVFATPFIVAAMVITLFTATNAGAFASVVLAGVPTVILFLPPYLVFPQYATQLHNLCLLLYV